MRRRIDPVRGLLTTVITALGGAALLAPADGGRTTLSLTANDVQYTVAVALPATWSVAPPTFENARTLVDVAPGSSGRASTEVQIYVEPRADHADALQQIQEATAAVPAEARSVTAIGGWPAVRIRQLETRPQPSQGTPYAHPEVLLIRAYVAVGKTLFVATGTLPPDASSELQQAVVDIIASLGFASTSDPAQLDRDLERLRTSAHAAPAGALGGLLALGSAGALAASGPEAGAVLEPNIRIDAAGRGELEVAVSPDGLDVVVALQSRFYVSSNDGGESFPNAGRPGNGNGDPSIALGQSGAFYMAWIDSSCSTNYANFDVTTQPAQPFGYDCTGIARSTDGGVTFQTNTVNPAVVCIGRAPAGMMDPAGACFPDQEHIAADSANAGTDGVSDQVYSTWRNFNSANQDAGLVCSQDDGVTWTAPITLGANSFFPRITVGQDGFVYVAAYGGANYRLWKFDSCANGLNLQAGFPVNVAARAPYACPFAGHDRCDQNPSSQTVAVDDTNPSHVYYAFAQDDAEGVNSYSTVFVRDSLDGGLTWPAGRVVQANSATNARRIMPWLCTTQGDAIVTWYEQAAPVPSDATHHVGAQVGLDNASNLTAKSEFTISEVADNWCDSGWPCGTRAAPGASESCPNQPQLAGFCGDGNNATPDSNIRCDFSDEAATPGTWCPQSAPGSPSGNAEMCLGGNGCPKYGDYNGNACVGGRLHAAWPSASSPPGVGPPNTATNTGVLYSRVAVNGPPVCDADGPYVAECGVATTLDGSASVDPEGQAPLTFTWTGPFAESPANGTMPMVTFSAPTGPKTVDLLVEDPDGLGEACTALVTVEDTMLPTIACNAPPTIVPPDAPISFVAAATDLCDADSAVTITGFDCFQFTHKGKRIDKTGSCSVAISGDTITILDSGGVNDHIQWTVVATDDSGNVAQETCEVLVANPGQGKP